MGQKIPTTVSFHLPDGREVVLETGKLAMQAHGSAVVRLGGTIILATVVSNKEAKEDQPFFPLSVDYQEKFSAAGRIPGNFFRREGRLSNYEILCSRLVDRAIRPLFPDGYMNETQVVITLLSADAETLPDALVALAASTALSVSDIPWDGPISEVRVAKIDGKYVVNPNRTDLEGATLDIIVAATLDNLMMVEGEASQCAEDELIEAIQAGHEAIKIQCNAQLELAKLVGDKALIKREVEPVTEDESLIAEIRSFITDEITRIAKGALVKQDRKDQLDELQKKLAEQLTEKNGEEWMEENRMTVENYFDKIKKEIIRNLILNDGWRLDGRKTDEVRPIWTEINYLTSTHGSAIFTRGETQALATVTLGNKMDKAMIDNALETYFEDFILHYNFPAFSVGEAKPNRGPGRREVGHGALAARSLRKVIPDEFPYTMRIVSDILESNGSSSMATVCAGTLAMMDGGVPIIAPVSGIAMGMISDGDRHAILSDILGDEDALGDMDFKVTGTRNGIVACQMDIKIDGLSYDLLHEALQQAKAGRLHILDEMAKTIAEPNSDLKPHAPRLLAIEIKKEQIGEVIGPGGKVIQEIQATTGTVITIEEIDNKGIVEISSPNKEGIEKAAEIIRSMTHEPQVGDVYDARVQTVMPYGVFVGFMGKHSGLVHVSELSHSRINNVEEVMSEGDEFKVKLIGVDERTGKLKLSRKALIPKPDFVKSDDRGDDQRNRPRDDRDRRDNRDRRDSRDHRNKDRNHGRRDDNRGNRHREDRKHDDE
jgi:polyribonucleotide nucleotidyltransferase